MSRKLALTIGMLSIVSSLLFAGFSTSEIAVTGDYLAHNINTYTEYENGSISSPPVEVWYAWVNVSKAQIIYYALFSDEVNSPIMNFLGQRFQIENDTDVFIGNALLLLEVYDDVDGNDIPQANFTSGESEIIYYMLVNSSAGYEVTPIQETLEGEIPHYTWGFKYNTIDGILLYPEQQPGNAAARVMIDYLGFNYDFFVDQNTSYMKTSFHIGSITDIIPEWGEPPVSLNGTSLSLLFSTITISAKPFMPYINDQPYNSTTTSDPGTATSSGQIAVEMIKAYEFLFGENYNLTREETVEMHAVKSEAAAVVSVPEGALDNLNWELTYFEDNLNLSELFPSTVGIGKSVNLDCNVSSLLYRICYPVWDGLAIEHDPTYVAYLFSNMVIPEFQSLIILPILVATMFIVVLYRRITE